MLLHPISFLIFSADSDVPVTGITVINTSISVIPGNTGSGTISIPTSNENDLVLVFAANENGSGVGGFSTAVASEGWTIDFDNLDASGPGAGMMYKIMGVTPDTTVTVGGSTQRNVVVIVVILRGANTTTPIDTATVLGTINTYIAGTITTVTPDAMIINANFLDDDDVADTGIPPLGYTMIESADTGHDDGTSGCTIDIAYKMMSSAGQEIPGAWTGLDDASRTYSIAIRAA